MQIDYSFQKIYMIHFEKFTLGNGLKVIVHEDANTPMVAVNILYDVGARDEDPSRTGLAHLFEHLMFGGSVHIPDYDTPLQQAGGENNAYTTNDFTNYYLELPKENLETAFWLESDRMLSLAFSPQSLEVQQKVVVEEFNEHYLAKPYGDAWHNFRKLAYKVHPYRWMTIGDKTAHIEEAGLDDVRAFFHKHYCPSNAILCVAGNTSVAEVKALAEKYFAPIPAGEKYERNLPAEPRQTEARVQELEGDVPVGALYKAWHIPGRMDTGYYVADLLTEILGSGQSSRLFQELVKQKPVFSAINCYHTGSLDPGLLVIEGKVHPDYTLEAAALAVEAVCRRLIDDGLQSGELEKVKNKVESMIVFEDMNLISRANNLAYYELLGDAGKMNTELQYYQEITEAELLAFASETFRKENSNTLLYRARQPEEQIDTAQ